MSALHTLKRPAPSNASRFKTDTFAGRSVDARLRQDR